MTENVSEAKARLRTKVLTDRSLALAAETAELFGKQLLKLCGQLGARTVGVYLSFGSEPAVGAKAAGMSLAAPRTGPESTMEFALLQGPTESTALGFLQPIGEIVEPGELDLIIAPALCLDEKGNRLGRGGGFFDRYLAEFSGSVAAVVYDHELLEAIPHEAHDKAVHYAVTQSRIQSLS
jgi:5-formyltetrahydrofolate cyclo-ligase